MTCWEKIFVVYTGKGSLSQIYKELLQIFFLILFLKINDPTQLQAKERNWLFTKEEKQMVNHHEQRPQPRYYETQILKFDVIKTWQGCKETGLQTDILPGRKLVISAPLKLHSSSG